MNGGEHSADRDGLCRVLDLRAAHQMWTQSLCHHQPMSNPDPAAAASTRDPDSALPGTAHEDREITEVVERLTARFPKERPERIRAAVDAAHEQFDGNPIRDFVPVFVERVASEELDRATP